jgi:hypothetical protein
VGVIAAANRFAAELYLSLLVADDLPEQEPEHAAARWYHLLWLLVPMLGLILFVETVMASFHAHRGGPSEHLNGNR